MNWPQAVGVVSICGLFGWALWIVYHILSLIEAHKDPEPPWAATKKLPENAPPPPPPRILDSRPLWTGGSRMTGPNVSPPPTTQKPRTQPQGQGPRR